MGALCDRMVEDLVVRGRAQNTIDAYCRCVGKFVEYWQQPPGRLTGEHVRKYLVYLAMERKLSAASQNVYAAAIGFFYRETLQRPQVVAEMPLRKVPMKLLGIVSRPKLESLLVARDCVSVKSAGFGRKTSTAAKCSLTFGSPLSDSRAEQGPARYWAMQDRGTRRAPACMQSLRLPATLLQLVSQPSLP